MSRRILVLAALLLQSALSGVAPGRAQAPAELQVLDLAGKPTTRITDGDTVRLQLSLSQPVTSPQTFTFRLDNTDMAVGSCDIGSGASCTTDAAPALGWHWDAAGAARDARTVKAYAAGPGALAESASITVLPRPVVLVHGFVSSADTWKAYLGPDGFLASLGLHGYAVGDGQVPGVMNTGVITEPTRRTATIAQNAAIEAQYIAAVKKATGAQMVDLVVHSMGGMISRYYIDRLMPTRDVAQLIMLGSPMGGTDCSVLPAALGFYLPASIEIRQSYMQGVFNRQVTHRHGVPFFDLGGTAISKAFQSPCAAVPNDLAVPFDSVNAIPLRSATMDVLHTELTNSPAVFHDFVQPLLQKPAGAFPSEPDPAAGAAGPASLPFTRVYTGHVANGGTQELTISIEPGVTVASFALYDDTRSVTVRVRGASGNVIQLDPQANGFVRVDDPSSLFYLGYGFSNPKPGQWKVEVDSTDRTPPAGAVFAISAYLIGGAQLDARSDDLIPKLGQTVHFTASVALNGQPLEITEAEAVVRGPDGKVETLALQAGSQASGSWVARTVGTHGVDIQVTGRLPDGTVIERTAFLAEEVQPNPTTLQVSFNLALLILAVVAVLAGLGLLVFRLSRGLFRRPRR